MENLSASGVQLPFDAKIMTDNVIAALKGNYYERNEAVIIQQLLPVCSRVLELGSGLGFISTFCAKHPRIDSVITIEANPQLAPYIANVHKINDVDAIVTPLTGVALANPMQKEIPFYIRQDFWASSLDKAAYGGYKESVNVPLIDLNEVIADHDPDLLVLDIEGGEVNVFDDLDLRSIKLIMMEVHQRAVGRRGIKKVFDDLSVRGFHYEQYHSAGQIVTFGHVDR